MRAWPLRVPAIILFFLLLPACGRKTPPVPPQAVQPVPITDLRVRLDDRGATLLWTAPRRTTGGEELTGIKDFEIYRAEVPVAESCPGCPLSFGPPIRYSGDAPQPGETIRFTETDLRPGYDYFFKVRTRLSWQLSSADSNLVSFSWDVLPAAPRGLTVQEGDQLLQLSWQPPARLTDGSPLAGPLVYQVYRRPSGAGFAPLGQPVPETDLTDRAVQNGRTYSYRVRALRRVKESLVAGPPSEIATGTPRDLTPPAPPRHLTAVSTPQGVKLAWQAVPEPDVAGYRIYRRQASAADKELIGETRVPTTRFTDPAPPKGKELFYSVTAVDQAAPANESAPSPRAKVTP